MQEVLATAGPGGRSQPAGGGRPTAAAQHGVTPGAAVQGAAAAALGCVRGLEQLHAQLEEAAAGVQRVAEEAVMAQVCVCVCCGEVSGGGIYGTGADVDVVGRGGSHGAGVCVCMCMDACVCCVLRLSGG